MSEIINWSSVNNGVLKINSLKYLLVFSYCNQILITSSKYTLNKTDDSGHPCLTPWVIALEFSDIPLPALTLIMFSVYIDSHEPTNLDRCHFSGLQSPNLGFRH